MPVENSTPNRGYLLPYATNDLIDDVLRIIAAITGIDLDVATLLTAVAGKAAAEHAHIIANTTGLQAALDSKQGLDEKGQANGFAALDATGKVPTSQLPAAVLGALSYQGVWNANTNTPTIPAASAANKGHFYKVTTSGSTNVSGETDWKVGDWIVSNGATWDKADHTDQVVSVAGLMGAITATALVAALAAETFTLVQPNLTLKQSANPVPTAEGDAQWDVDDNVLVIGDGAGQKIFVALPAGTVAGDILYLSAAKAFSRLAKGSAGQLLAMNSGGTAPGWQNDQRIGVGQTWVDLLASRVHTTSYQNTTGRPIEVAVKFQGTGASRAFQVSTDNVNWVAIIGTGSGIDGEFAAVIPPGHYYRINGASTVWSWAELR